MVAADLILLLFLYVLQPLSCSNITREVSTFLEDNGYTYVSVVVGTPIKRDTLTKEIVMNTSRTLYARAISTGSVEYIDEGFNVFPVTLKEEEVVKNVMKDIGATRVQHSLVVARETWSNLDFGVFLEFVEQGPNSIENFWLEFWLEK